MTRLIDADRLIKVIEKAQFEGNGNIMSIINDAPTVDKRPHGKWELHRKDLRVWFECSNCGAYNGGFETDFCPCCGAAMDLCEVVSNEC